nr:hypothetical protein [uncultured Butyrivibrio sp.]
MGIFLLYAFALAIALKYKRTVGDAAAIGLMVIITSYSICGELFSLTKGFYAVLVICSFCVGYCILSCSIHFRDSLKIIISPGSIILIVLIVFFAISSMGRGYRFTDEYDYWAYNLKGYYYLDDIRSGGICHPHAFVIWWLFAEKTWICFSESMALFAQCVAEIVMLLPLTNYIKGKHIVIKSVCITTIIVLIPMMLWKYSYSSILGDGLLFCGVIYTIITMVEYLEKCDKWYAFQLLWGAYILSSIKRIGILYASLIIMFMVLVCFQDYYQFIKRDKNTILYLVAMIAIPSFTYIFWLGTSMYALLPIVGAIGGYLLAKIVNCRSVFIRHEDFFAGIGICLLFFAGFITIYLFSKTAHLNRIIIASFIDGIVNTHLVSVGNIVPLSLMTLTLLLIVLLIVYYGHVRRGTEKVWNRFDFAFLWSSIGVIIINTIFLLALLITFITQIHSQYAGEMDRYSLPCFAGIVILFILFAIKKYSMDEFRTIVYLTIAIVLFTNVADFSKYLIDRRDQFKFYGFESAGIELKETDRLYLVYEEKLDLENDINSAFLYEMYPCSCSIKNGMTWEKIGDGQHITSEELAEELLDGNYNYVYIQTVDEEFANDYSDMFEDAENVKSGDVYEVVQDKNDVVFLRKIAAD